MFQQQKMYNKINQKSQGVNICERTERNCLNEMWFTWRDKHLSAKSMIDINNYFLFNVLLIIGDISSLDLCSRYGSSKFWFGFLCLMAYQHL